MVRPIRGVLRCVEPLRAGEQHLDLDGNLGLGPHHQSWLIARRRSHRPAPIAAGPLAPKT
jgi:hypothetical protein